MHAALEEEASASGKEKEAVGIFERFAGIMTRPADGQAQAQAEKSSEKCLDYVPG